MMGGRVDVWDAGKEREVGLVDAQGQPFDKEKLGFNDNQ